MRAPLIGMLLVAIPAGCVVGAISAARFSGETFGQVAMIITTAFTLPLSVGVAGVAIVGFLIAKSVASRLPDDTADAAGLVGAALLGAVALAVASTSELFSPSNYLWPCVGALGGALIGGATAVLLKREPRAPALPLKFD